MRAPRDPTEGGTGRQERKLHLAPEVDPQTTAMQALLDEFEETMAGGDAARLAGLSERLWKHRRRLPDLIVERFHADRVKQPRLAFELILRLAGGRAPAFLKRIAADRALEDIVRWGARRRAGWGVRAQPKARREFLASLNDPLATLVVALSQSQVGHVADGEILQEVLAYLQVIAPGERMAFVQQGLAQDVPALPWILRCLIHLDGDPNLQLACVSALVNRTDSGAIGALERVARSSRNAAVRDEASAAARRLRFQVLRPASAAAGPDEQAQPELERAQLSSVDGEGSQLLVLTRKWAPDQLLSVMVYLNDADGIRDVLGTFREWQPDLIDESLDLMPEPPLLVDVELPAARGALAAGEAVVGKGQKLPLHYELWEPYFHDRFPAPADEETILPELDDAPYAQRRDLVARSAQLLDHPAFSPWFADLDEVVDSLDFWPTRNRRGLSKSEYSQIVPAVFGESAREVLRGRLRRQAWLLDRQHDNDPRDLALAAAASLDAAPQKSLNAHPLLRAMIDRALDMYIVHPMFDLF